MTTPERSRSPNIGAKNEELIPSLEVPSSQVDVLLLTQSPLINPTCNAGSAPNWRFVCGFKPVPSTIRLESQNPVLIIKVFVLGGGFQARKISKILGIFLLRV